MANTARRCALLVGFGTALLAAPTPGWAQQQAAPGPTPRPDAQREVEMTFELFDRAKTEQARDTAGEYLSHLDRGAVATTLVEHISQARTGEQATRYNLLLETIKPEGCAAVLRQLHDTKDVEVKGKLLVSLRHCPDPQAVTALQDALADKRPVHFAAHGRTPRRICDLAYDELFLKLRDQPRYGLDPSAKMQGIIREKTPVKTRDELIAKLTARLKEASPAAASSPPTPSTAPLHSPTSAGVVSPGPAFSGTAADLSGTASGGLAAPRATPSPVSSAPVASASPVPPKASAKAQPSASPGLPAH